MNDLSDNLLEFITCIGDCVNSRCHLLPKFVLEIGRELLRTGQPYDGILEILLPRDRIANGFCKVAKKMEIGPELVELRMTGEQGRADVPSRSKICVDQITDCDKGCASVIQCGCESRSHNADPCYVSFTFVTQHIPSLLPRHVNRDQNRQDAADCLYPSGLLAGRETAPSNPFAIHVFPLCEWGRS